MGSLWQDCSETYSSGGAWRPNCSDTLQVEQLQVALKEFQIRFVRYEGMVAVSQPHDSLRDWSCIADAEVIVLFVESEDPELEVVWSRGQGVPDSEAARQSESPILHAPYWRNPAQDDKEREHDGLASAVQAAQRSSSLESGSISWGYKRLGRTIWIRFIFELRTSP